MEAEVESVVDMQVLEGINGKIAGLCYSRTRTEERLLRQVSFVEAFTWSLEVW